MTKLEVPEKREWLDYIMAKSKKEQNDLLFSVEKFQVESILNELVVYINPLDTWKQNELVNYICKWKLWSKERKDLEKMVNYMIYWSYGKTSAKENSWARKLKYILDNYWRGINTVLIEIKNKEQTMKPKTSPKPKEEKKEWVLEWALNRLKDVYNYWSDMLSDLWYAATNLIPPGIKNWVRENLFSPEKQKNTENINEIYKNLKWKEKPDFLPFYLAMQWYNKQKNSIWNKKYLTVIDYSKPPYKNRFYLMNMDTLTVENCVPTWHGKNSWNTQETSSFSNKDGSNQTSIGFFRTPYDLRRNRKRTWRWLFLSGMEGSNDNALKRWLAIHEVWDLFWGSTKNGHRKWESTSDGCITIRSADNPNEIMNKIKWDALVYSYFPDMTYLNSSRLIA